MKSNTQPVHDNPTTEPTRDETPVEHLPACREGGASAPPARTVDARPYGSALELAIQQGANIETIERLVALIERREQREAEKALWDALAAAQGEFPEIPKTRTARTKTYTYKYASLDDIQKIVYPILSKHGLSVTFKKDFHRDSKGGDKVVAVSSAIELHHSAGATTTFPPVVLPIDDGYMSDIQKFGSSMTYADRYALMGALGIRPCDEDNDAGPAPAPRREPRRASQPPAEQAPPASGDQPPTEAELAELDRRAAAEQAGAPNLGGKGWRMVVPKAYAAKPTKKGTTRHAIKVEGKGGEVWASTFSESDGALLREAHEQARAIWIRVERKNEFFNIEEVYDDAC